MSCRRADDVDRDALFSDLQGNRLRRMMRANPIPQPWLQPEDVSRGVVYLVTDPGVITGSVLEIGLGGSARIH